MSCTNLSRARQPQANGTSATAHRAAVRVGRVTGVTPTTGSLARIDRVSQYAAIMPQQHVGVCEGWFDVLDVAPHAAADVAVPAGTGPPGDACRRIRLVGQPDPA